jgi:hypothetical protein
MMRNLLRVIRRRARPVACACVLLVGGIGAGVLAGAGAAQATTGCGAPIAAGTSCTDTGTVTYSGGNLTLTSPAALAWSTTDNGLDQQLVDATTAHQSYVVDDATGSDVGWNVTVSATTFTGTVTPFPTLANAGTFSTNGSIASATATTPPTGACTSGATCTPPTNSMAALGYPVAITTAALSPTAVKIYDTSGSTGVGSITVGLPGAAAVGWWVSVPANAVAATYTSTITLEVISAP